MLNKCMIIGFLGADPEVRAANNGSKIVNLRLATSERWTAKDGQKKERTEWHTVVIFNERLAEVAQQFLRKGSKVYIEGQLQTRKWQDKSGADRYSTEIVLQNFGGQLVLLDGKDAPAVVPVVTQDRTGAGKPYTPKQAVQDDIPFAFALLCALGALSGIASLGVIA